MGKTEMQGIPRRRKTVLQLIVLTTTTRKILPFDESKCSYVLVMGVMGGKRGLSPRVKNGLVVSPSGIMQVHTSGKNEASVITWG